MKQNSKNGYHLQASQNEMGPDINADDRAGASWKQEGGVPLFFFLAYVVPAR
jgi:hypothetical protein